MSTLLDDPAEVKARPAPRRKRRTVALLAAAVTVFSILGATPAYAETPAADLPNLLACPTMRVGSTGPCVEALQYSLKTIGLEITQDGQYGPQTAAAVRTAQQLVSVGVDSVAGPQTIAAVDRAANSPGAAYASFGGCRMVYLGDSGSPCVHRLQVDLALVGYPVVADGDFGPQTLVAVQSFQGFAGLAKTSWVDRQLAALLETLADPIGACRDQRMAMHSDGSCFQPGDSGAVTALGKSPGTCALDAVKEKVPDDLIEEGMKHFVEQRGIAVPERVLKIFGRYNAGVDAVKVVKCIMFDMPEE